MKRTFALCLMLVMAAACGDFAPGSATSSVGARHQSGTCPSSVAGSGTPGSPCLTFDDCKEVCCSCVNGRAFAAAACVDGQCAPQSDACGKGSESYPLICG